MIRSNLTEHRLRLAATVAGLYVLPVLALATGTIGAQWRFHLLLAISAVALLLAYFRNHSIAEAGVDAPVALALIKWSVAPAVLLLLFISASGAGGRFSGTERVPFYLFFFFVAAPAQEFLYRKFLFAELRAARISANLTILLSASLFAFMHIIYKDALTLIFTFVLGILWGMLYTRTRSFFVVALSHAILGVGAIGLGVI